jgi:hypothetical protein
VNPLFLGGQAVVFAVWAALMFHALFRLRRRAVLRTGQSMPGLGATLEGFSAFLTLPEFRGLRRLLGLTTAALFALILLNVYLAKG